MAIEAASACNRYNDQKTGRFVSVCWFIQGELAMAINVDTQKRKDISLPSIYFILRWKILIGFTLIFSVVFAISFYWFYQFATNAALTRIQDDLTSTLAGGATGVNTDELLALARDGKPNAAGQAWDAVGQASDDAETARLAKAAVETYGQSLPGGFS